MKNVLTVSPLGFIKQKLTSAVWTWPAQFFEGWSMGPAVFYSQLEIRFFLVADNFFSSFLLFVSLSPLICCEDCRPRFSRTEIVRDQFSSKKYWTEKRSAKVWRKLTSKSHDI